MRVPNADDRTPVLTPPSPTPKTLRALVQQANARQYLERLAASPAAVPSPRAGCAEEELALQALQHLKDDPSSEKKANPNGAGLAAPFDAIAAAATGRDGA